MQLLPQWAEVAVVDAAAVEVLHQLGERRDPSGSVAADAQVIVTALLPHLDGLDDNLDSGLLRGEGAAVLPGAVAAGVTLMSASLTCATVRCNGR